MLQGLFMTALFFLPTAILLFFTLAVRLEKPRDPLSGVRLKIFDSALLISALAVVLLVAGLTRYAVTRTAASPFWIASNFTAIGLWALGCVGAFFGKNKGRLLLLLAQGTALFAAWACLMMTIAD
jgi:hypothetical protein